MCCLTPENVHARYLVYIFQKCDVIADICLLEKLKIHKLIFMTFL